jgi:hypothetical protein
MGLPMNAVVEGPRDLRLPVVILMHGLGGTSADMTAPLTTRGGFAFNQSGGFALYNDAGVHLTPPLTPVASFFIDPPLTAVTSWKDALVAAGFTTVTYSQTQASIAGDVTDLTGLAVALAGDSDLAGFSFAFVAHSRGGLVVRSFLASASRAITPLALAAFMARTTTLITLHSPNAGSGLATVAGSVNGLAARLQLAVAAMGLPPLAPLATLRSVVGTSAQLELTPGSATLAGIAAAEPVPGIAYHTFGGTSTNWLRLWANVYTPDSWIPPLSFVGIPLPIFQWGTSSVVLGSLLNYGSFLPTDLLVGPTPVITETTAALAALAALTPELTPGLGDTFVTDARSRLPFSTTHTTNPLHHLEALYDPTLQRQVIAILSGLRTPLFAGRAIVTLHPFPARPDVSTNYTVTAIDSVSGIPLIPFSVSVRGSDGGMLLMNLGASFTFTFVAQHTGITGGSATHRGVFDVAWPRVDALFGGHYGTVSVPIGLIG